MANIFQYALCICMWNKNVASVKALTGNLHCTAGTFYTLEHRTYRNNKGSYGTNMEYRRFEKCHRVSVNGNTPLVLIIVVHAYQHHTTELQNITRTKIYSSKSLPRTASDVSKSCRSGTLFCYNDSSCLHKERVQRVYAVCASSVVIVRKIHGGWAHYTSNIWCLTVAPV